MSEGLRTWRGSLSLWERAGGEGLTKSSKPSPNPSQREGHFRPPTNKAVTGHRTPKEAIGLTGRSLFFLAVN